MNEQIILKFAKDALKAYEESLHKEGRKLLQNCKEILIDEDYLQMNNWMKSNIENVYQNDDVFIELGNWEMQISVDDGEIHETWYKGNIPTIGEFETLRKLLEI